MSGRVQEELTVRRLLASLLSLALLAVPVLPSQADKAYFPWELEQPEGTVAMTLDDGIYRSSPSYIEISRVVDTWDNGSKWWSAFTHCTSLDEAPCDPSMKNSDNQRVFAQLNMPICETSGQNFCIEQVAIYDQGQPLEPAEFIRYNSGPTVEADPKRNLPKGSPVSLWRGKSNHSGGTNTYAVQVRAGFEYDKGKFSIEAFEANVLPYVDIPSAFDRSFRWQEKENGTKIVQGFEEGFAYTDPTSVGEIHNFNLETRVSLTLRMPSGIRGWIKGRATDPNFSLTKINNQANRWVLNAKPVVVPKLRVFATDEQRTKKMREVPMWSDGRAQSATNLSTSSEGWGAFEWIKDLRSLAKDTATAQVSVWQLGATIWGTRNCDARARGVSGFVLTNSMAYGSEAPQYRRGFLDYEVAGMHFLPDGTEALGTYDLVMDSNVARCLYGFSKAPVGGTITISGEGDKNIATTVVGEKGGWLRLSAYGFTFSQKTIRVKLSQKKTTITCVTTTKPTKTKRVTALSPKCPSGYKQR